MLRCAAVGRSRAAAFVAGGRLPVTSDCAPNHANAAAYSRCVAIYLDTNALYNWRTFAELDRVALSVAAARLRQQIVIPSLVVDEAAARHRRLLDRAVDTHTAGVRELSRLYEESYDDFLEPWPDTDLVVARWHSRLREFADVIETTADHCAAGLQREIGGRAPARARTLGKPGSGCRDAAIWLTILEHHVSTGTDSILITDDSGFWRTKSDEFHPHLRAELPTGCAFAVHRTVGDLVAMLGTKSDAVISVADLPPGIGVQLESEFARSPKLAAAVWDRETVPPGAQGQFRDVTAQPLRVRAARTYDNGGRKTALFIDADWRLGGTYGYADPSEDGGRCGWIVLNGISFDARIQVLCEGDSVQVIGADFRADITLHRSDDGQIWSMGPPARPAGD